MRIRAKLSIILSGVALLYLALVILISEDLSSPAKREIMPYHRTWLDTPNQQAIQLSRHRSPIGNFPYLVVEPSGAESAKRGSILRSQLDERGLEIPPFGAVEQNIILFHGRKGRKEDFLPVAERYTAVGYRCIIPDLPGHGDNPVARSCFGTDSQNQEALFSIVQAEEEKTNFSKKPVLLGMSMGGSFACQLAGKHSELFSALIIINSFDQLQNVVAHKCDSYLLGQGGLLSTPVMLCSQSLWGFDIKKADSAHALQTCDLPILVAHGDEDKLIPIQLGKNLYNAASSTKKKWIEVKGAHHTNVLVTAHPLYTDTVQFLQGKE